MEGHQYRTNGRDLHITAGKLVRIISPRSWLHPLFPTKPRSHLSRLLSSLLSHACVMGFGCAGFECLSFAHVSLSLAAEPPGKYEEDGKWDGNSKPYYKTIVVVVSNRNAAKGCCCSLLLSSVSIRRAACVVMSRRGLPLESL